MTTTFDYTERIDALLNEWFGKHDMTVSHDILVNCDYVMDRFYSKYETLDENITKEELFYLLDVEYDNYVDDKEVEMVNA